MTLPPEHDARRTLALAATVLLAALLAVASVERDRHAGRTPAPACALALDTALRSR